MIPFFVQIKCHLGKSYQVANAIADAEIALISSLSSIGFGYPSRATLIMARPSCSLVVMYFGAVRARYDSSGAATT